MKTLKNLSKAILAGIMISLGGAVYLASENKIVGAILFSLGLTVILLQSFFLFTGKTAYIFENKFSYTLTLLLIWIGNLIGTIITGILIHFGSPKLADTANELCNKKLTQTPIETFILGALCGILVYIAVDYFNNGNSKSDAPKYILVFTCVPAFILCGFEHSIADMFYFSASTNLMIFSVKGILYILLVSLGNLIGAVLFHLLKKFALNKIK